MADCKIYSTLQIGAFHTNHCEDFLIHEQIGSNKILIAVLDGCTMGTESVFASMLIGKILRKIAKKNFYKEFTDGLESNLKIELKEIIYQLFQDIKSIKNQLFLDTVELLSTLIIGLVECNKRQAEFLVIGDGLIHFDGNLFEFEQNDRPDYLAYHLSENFEYWYNVQKQFLSVSYFKDLSICTDGIFTFKNLNKKENQKAEEEIIAYLLKDDQYAEFNNFLNRKIRFIKNKWGHVVTDDLAIIRIR